MNPEMLCLVLIRMVDQSSNRLENQKSLIFTHPDINKDKANLLKTQIVGQI